MVYGILDRYYSRKDIVLVVPGFEPQTSRKLGECSTIELHMIAVFLLFKISMSERACSPHILCVSDSRYTSPPPLEAQRKKQIQ